PRPRSRHPADRRPHRARRGGRGGLLPPPRVRRAGARRARARRRRLGAPLCRRARHRLRRLGPAHRPRRRARPVLAALGHWIVVRPRPHPRVGQPPGGDLKMRRLLVLLLAVAAVAAGCAGSSSPPSVRVGALYPRTGTQAAGGTDEERGVALAVEWANSHGGVNGRHVRLEAVDAPRAEAVPAALGELKRRGVSVVIGSHGSSISAVAASLAGKENLSFWETGAVGEV